MDETDRPSCLVGRFMCRVQAMQGRHENSSNHVRRQLATSQDSVSGKRAKRHAMNVFHDDEQLFASLDDVEDLHDIGVRESGTQAGFTSKTLGEVLVECVLRVHPLDRHHAREVGGTGKPAQIDRCHPAHSDLDVQRVVPADHESGRRECVVRRAVVLAGGSRLSRIGHLVR